MFTQASAAILQALRSVAEDKYAGWSEVYLDNVRPVGVWPIGVAPRAFSGHLSALEQAGLYRPIDGFARGEVRMIDG